MERRFKAPATGSRKVPWTSRCLGQPNAESGQSRRERAGRLVVDMTPLSRVYVYPMEPSLAKSSINSVIQSMNLALGYAELEGIPATYKHQLLT